MTRVRLFVLLPVVMATVLMGASVANADSAITKTHFSAQYDSGDFGFMTCDGNRIVKTGPDGYVKDSETCDVSGGFLRNGRISLTPDPDPQWLSDYEFFVAPGGEWCFNPAISGTIVITANGGTWSIEAYYDPNFSC